MTGTKPPRPTKPNQAVYYVKPGLHSRNASRRSARRGFSWGLFHYLRLALLIVGVCAIGYYGYTLADQYVYQAYQNWAFDKQIAGRHNVMFADYLRERTPFGFLVGGKTAEPETASAPPVPEPSSAPPEIARPAEGSLLGRIAIPRLNLTAVVREGVDAKTLSLAVGHVPSTSLPGQIGNFAIAAHRDTLFRALKDIRKGDLVDFQAPDGTYKYQVLATKIVAPSDVSVLRSDGGGLMVSPTASSDHDDPERLITMITCYPFYYVGSAPKRFIVEGRLVSADSSSQFSSLPAENSAPPRAPSSQIQVTPTPQTERALVHHKHKPAIKRRINRPAGPQANSDNTPAPKKRHFWQKLFHAS